MKHRILLLFAVVSLCVAMPAQNSKTLTSLRNRRALLQKRIKQSESVLRSTNSNVKRQLSDLTLLNGQIEVQKQTMHGIQLQIDSIKYNIGKLSNHLQVLSRQLEEKKQNFRRSMLYLYRNRNTQNKLLFILSADNFSQMLRRYRYVREYAKYQRVQGELIKRKEEQVQRVQGQLLQTKASKNQMLTVQQIENRKLTSQQVERQKTVTGLQKKQKQLQSVIASNKKEMAQLNGRIDYYVRLAIEQERKRREAAERARQAAIAREKARRAAEAERQAAEQAAAEKAAANASASKSSSKSSRPSRRVVVEREEEKPEPMQFRENDADTRLSNNFAANRGRLPMPITGSYVISAHYGSYSLSGLSGVRLDNKGINITGRSGACARAIFSGEVSAVFSLGGLVNVLVRHGSYISVYCNLSSASVRQGQSVSTRTILGSVAKDASGNCTLHFQLRKETATLNPEAWLAR